MIIKTIIGSLLAGVIYTVIIGVYFKKKGINPSRKYISGIVFTIVFFVLNLIMNHFL